jgi:hypothetical protein
VRICDVAVFPDPPSGRNLYGSYIRGASR